MDGKIGRGSAFKRLLGRGIDGYEPEFFQALETRREIGSERASSRIAMRLKNAEQTLRFQLLRGLYQCGHFGWMMRIVGNNTNALLIKDGFESTGDRSNIFQCL
ncbi:hypothetical protein P4C99_10640 [Pontiellaceae bacterium B1224]|nr:hypothetical protein [Pontiellaceae bacterium B1224]